MTVRRSKFKALDEFDPARELIEKAEHLLHVTNALFRHRKRHYKGLANNAASLQNGLQLQIGAITPKCCALDTVGVPGGAHFRCLISGMKNAGWAELIGVPLTGP